MLKDFRTCIYLSYSAMNCREIKGYFYFISTVCLTEIKFWKRELFLINIIKISLVISQKKLHLWKGLLDTFFNKIKIELILKYSIEILIKKSKRKYGGRCIKLFFPLNILINLEYFAAALLKQKKNFLFHLNLKYLTKGTFLGMINNFHCVKNMAIV